MVTSSTIIGDTLVFIDNLGYLFSHIESIDIGLLPQTDIQGLSPDIFNLGNFIFGSMLNLTTFLLAHIEMTIWCRIQFSVNHDVINHIHNFSAPP